MGNKSSTSLQTSSVWMLARYGDPNALRVGLKRIPAETKSSYLDWSGKPDYRTPLAMASLVGYFECVKILLDAGADPNRVGRDGMGPLHLAVKTNNVAITRLLLETPHVDCNLFDAQGYTPLMVAVASGHVQALDMLLNWHQIDIFAYQAESKLNVLRVARKACRESKLADRPRFKKCLGLVEKVRSCIGFFCSMHSKLTNELRSNCSFGRDICTSLSIPN